MKNHFAIYFALILGLFTAPSSFGQFSIENLNAQLPKWGTSWKAGATAVHGYYPSFYAGFAPRSQAPERIHVRTSRGNQTRVSIILDETTILDYLFDLKKRYDFYNSMISGELGIRLETSPIDGHVLPLHQNFNEILQSPHYRVLEHVERIGAQLRNSTPPSDVLRADIYRTSLNTLSSLNPHRIYKIQLNLTREFSRWAQFVRSQLAGQGSPQNFYARNSQSALIALNMLVWGRVNLTEIPTAPLIQQLARTAELANSLVEPEKSSEFVLAARDLFLLATGQKYDFRVLNSQGQWTQALQCTSPSSCILTYPEFTTVYPTGSADAVTKDRFGNPINYFATPGLWHFIDRGYHQVDHIRGDSYYAWVPKMDFEEIGNGFHNPAVRLSPIPEALKPILDIPPAHSSLHTVLRGRVSSGCLRLPSGHAWELRHLFPVENEKMKQVLFFGNHHEDFDLYDIDGDGEREIMGVEYYITYQRQSGAKREGQHPQVKQTTNEKTKYFELLYGISRVLNLIWRGETPDLRIQNPFVSIPSRHDWKKKSVSTRLEVVGEFPVRQLPFEKEKLQHYTINRSANSRDVIFMNELLQGSQTSNGKRIVRLMGRVRGCAPFSNKEQCGEAAFEREVQEVRTQLSSLR